MDLEQLMSLMAESMDHQGGDSQSSDSSDSDAEDPVPADILSGAADIIKTMVEAMKAEQTSSSEKLSALSRVQKLVRKMKGTKPGEVGSLLSEAGALDAWTCIVQNTLDVSSQSGDSLVNWKMVNIIYKILAKISTCNHEFSRDLAKMDLLTCTVETLRSPVHQQRCVNEPIASATSWMLELVGNCYDSFEDTARKQQCRELGEVYFKIHSQKIKFKAGQMKFAITLKDQLHQAAHDAGATEGRSVEIKLPNMETLPHIEELSKEAERSCQLGMPRVFTEQTKMWWSKPDRWEAFNKKGKHMWKTLQQGFQMMVTLGKFSTTFREALCQAGIIDVLPNILGNTEIQEAYMRNKRVREVVAGSLVLTLSALHVQSACKNLQAAEILKCVQMYLSSKDDNIRGHALLIVANLAKLDRSVMSCNISFTTSDMKLLIATYIAYRSEGGPLGDFLARTNFPEICVQEMRNFLIRDPGNDTVQDTEWEELLHLFISVHAFSRESEDFVRSLVKVRISEPLQLALSSQYFRAREQSQGCQQMLEMSAMIIHNCVRVSDKDCKRHFLIPNLWPHIYSISTARKIGPLKDACAFLAFVHMHALTSDGTPSQVTIDKFPKMQRSFQDIEYIGHVWNIANAGNERVLGNYLSATGGAVIHAELLKDLVENLAGITSKETMKKAKPLLGNMNNMALESGSFAEELCRNGVLNHLKIILCRSGLDLGHMNDADKELVLLSLSIAHSCAEYSSNMEYFRSAGICNTLCECMMADLPTNTRRRATNAVIFIWTHDQEQVASYIAKHRVSALNEKDVKFYQYLSVSSNEEKIGDKAGDLLVELGIAETMGRKLQELAHNKGLLTEFAITEPLLRALWNYTNYSQKFSSAMCDVGIFRMCQQVITTPAYRDNKAGSEKNKFIMHSSLGILLNAAQYEANHATFHSLRLTNDLLRCTTSRDGHVRSTATLTVSLLINEDNAHLVRSSSYRGVVHALLEKLNSSVKPVVRDQVVWTASALLKGLSKVALNDTNKAILVYDGILPILAHILLKGNKEEKLLAAHLTWSLAFQEDNKYLMQEEETLTNALRNYSGGDERKLRTQAMGALSQLEITQERVFRLLNTQPSTTDTMENDIFLSHHPSSKPLISQVKDSLETEGFKVILIDHDTMTDDLFTQMTSAVERSRVVIVEVSREYQRSLFCRTEAEYSHKLLKPVVPIRTQRGFKPSSWLLQVCCGHSITDFSSPDETGMDTLVAQLLKEVKHALRQSQPKE